MRSAIEFLKGIYSQQCEDNDYIVLSVKGPDVKWKDVPIVYNKSFDKALKGFFDKYPPTEYDLYWSPMPYSGPAKRIEYSLDTKFLAQDIDEHEDPDSIEPKPSYIWESSPNKYQGLWELDRYIEEPEYTPLNKALAKHLGCDDCFDYAHVYRIPGTLNHKYKDKPEVGEPQETRKIYKPKQIKKDIGFTEGRKEPKTSVTNSSDLTERKIYAQYSIPQKVRDLLALDDLTGIDRSGTIWYIEHKLYELGMTPNEIIYLVKNSAFNKYKGRKDEDKRLKQELEKIISGAIVNQEKEARPLQVTSYSEVMSNLNTFEGWLVKGFWGRRSHGIVAGMPKTFKSTLVHDLIVSVASGRDFLGKYPVLDPGPVIVIQNENAEWVMKDRTEKLIHQKGLGGKVDYLRDGKLRVEFPQELPISFINQQGFLLSDSGHREHLEKMIEEIKPVLVVLDPLYLMFDGDLNSAKELNPALNWLLHLKNHYKTSVMLIHHYNKGGQGAPTKGGSRMMGSIILYGWVESAWYLSKEEEEEIESVDQDEIDLGSNSPAVITMNREFRMAGHFPEIDIHLSMGEMGDPRYEVEVSLSGDSIMPKDTIKDSIINYLSSSTVPVTRRALAENLGLDSRRVKQQLDELLNEKRIIATDKGFTVYRGYNN